MNIRLCARCGGSKKIAPMGGIHVTCTVCNGVGHTKIADPIEPIKILQEETIITEPTPEPISEEIAAQPILEPQAAPKKMTGRKRWESFKLATSE